MRPYFSVFILLILLFAPVFAANPPVWGFFGHRRINRLAVFTLPPDMIRWHKKHLEYLTEHAVDTKHEAVRHYMDLDRWGRPPFSNLPRDWSGALAWQTDLGVITSDGDTVMVWGPATRKEGKLAPVEETLLRPARGFFIRNILPQYYEDNWTISMDSLQKWLPNVPEGKQIVYEDHLSPHGIVPYHLESALRRLTEAFQTGNTKRILQLSADFGHYIGDAHVPLHTTENYNGQLTDQLGIHAFWESRLPELYADEEYDFFVGPATYIRNPREYFWNITLKSHELVDSVLAIEKRLSVQFPEDQQYCYDERLGVTIRTQCQPYARAYHEALKGMVEQRMREAVLSVGSVWYTAWVDAGQPNLDDLPPIYFDETDRKAEEELQQQVQAGKQLGRAHEN